MISSSIKIKNNQLPDVSGVYYFYDQNGILLYIGKAGSLKRRVSSYFSKAHDNRIGEMVRHISHIDYQETATVIEALILEANEIKNKKPKYNIRERDDKSFLYLAITSEKFPRPLLLRAPEWRGREKKFLVIFGPYPSATSLRTALALVRRSIPWSTCQSPVVTGKKRACFNVALGKCPGVCSGAISSTQYKKIIRNLILFFSGKKTKLLLQMKQEMAKAAKEQKYELAAELRNRVFALEHIQDVALISKDEHGFDFNGRIEAYDISNISGASAVGSMVVFENGRPAKDKYRRFKIKTVQGANDVGMMEEMLRRRLRHTNAAWTLPRLIIIDGGEGQVHRVVDVMQQMGVVIPVIGIAKGFDRKQDRLVFDKHDQELARVAPRGKELFQKARDEAHRFAVQYHRQLRSQALFN